MRWLLLVDVETQHTDCCHHCLDYTHHKWSITLGGVIIVSRRRDTAHWLLPPKSGLHTSQVIHYTWWSDYCLWMWRHSTLTVATTVWITHITSDPLHLVRWLLLVDVETQHTDCCHHCLDYTHHKWSITLGGVIIVSRCRDTIHWLLPPQSRLHTSQVIHYTWWSDYC